MKHHENTELSNPFLFGKGLQGQGSVPFFESGQQCEERLSPANPFRLEIEHFSDCVLSGKTPRLSQADAKSNCQIIVAAIESADQGRRIQLG